MRYDYIPGRVKGTGVEITDNLDDADDPCVLVELHKIDDADPALDRDGVKQLRDVLSRALDRGEARQAVEARRRAWLDRTCTVCEAAVHREAVMIDYMATDQAWDAAGFGAQDLACLGCFERRLGEPLAERHLTNAVVNRTLRWLLRQGLAPWRQRALY